MRKHGHPIIGAITGLLFGLSLSLGAIVILGVNLSNDVLGILPPLFLVLGIVWGRRAPPQQRKTKLGSVEPYSPRASTPSATSRASVLDGEGSLPPLALLMSVCGGDWPRNDCLVATAL